MKHFLLFLFLFPVACFAQLRIKGRVVSEVDGKPIADASVFLNNSTIGTKANTDGAFTLYRLNPGQYELIVSVIGYETQRREIIINNNLIVADIKMRPKTTTLNEVIIGGKDPKRDRKLRMFKEQFLGRALFWRDCKILNPQILKLTFSKHDQVLTATTDDFLGIENDALGYKLKYLLNTFVLDKQAFNMKYEGFALFEEMDGSAAQNESWTKNRHLVYYGSPTHFLRAVLSNTVDSDFVVRPFCIKYIDENIIPYRIERYDTLRSANYVHRTDKRGIYAINYPSDIDVFYFPPGNKHFRDLIFEYGNRGQVGSIDFIDKSLFFDINGTILNPTGAFFRYKWGTNRIAEILPIDYWPPTREPKGKKLNY
ncbi:hypothetical protein ABIB62_001244 [Mucilaginibacter sp. UYP25]|uniref:carboxypeptidase-like regulatory domain-containing protein n=1 Tax=unclassified Mucilaginibacter TaxID=2617802 RepID=UPI003395DD72